MGNRSKYSQYKSLVRYYLVKTFQWEKETATEVTTAKEFFLRSLMNTDCPASTAASKLNEQRKQS